MFQFILCDENFDIISESEFKDLSELYCPSEKVKNVSNIEPSKLLSILGYEVSIFEPYNGGEDFLTVYMDNDMIKEDLKNMKGCLFGEIFPINVELGIFEVLQRVNSTEKPLLGHLVGYSNEKLVCYYDCNFIKLNGYLYILYKDLTSSKLIDEKIRLTFEKSMFGLAIFRDDNLVKANDSFANILGFKDLFSVYDYGLKLSDLLSSVKNLNQDIENILSDEMYMIEFTFKFEDLNSKIHWIRGKLNKTDYINHPAISLSCNEITNEIEANNKTKKLEHDLKTVISLSKLAILSWDKKLGYIWRKDILNLFEIDNLPKNASSKNIIFNYVASDEEKEYIRTVFKKAMIIKKSNVQTEFNIITAKGNWKHIKSNVRLSYDDNGFVTEVLGYFQDNTSSKSLEKLKLEDFENSSQGRFILQNEKFVRVNQAFADIFKKDKSFFINKSLDYSLDIRVNSDELGDINIKEGYNQIIDNKLPLTTGILEFHLEDGVSWYDTVATYITYGERPAIEFICKDISHEKKSEIQILELNNTLDIIQDLSEMAVISWSKNEGYLLNKYLAKLLDLNTDDFSVFTPKNLLLDYIVSDEKKVVMNLIEKSKNENLENIVFKTKISTEKGKLKDVLVKLKCSYNENNSINSVIGYIQDISENI